MGSAPAKVISITSGKGGVGKTSIAVNLGLTLVKAGKRVLILDADLGLANVNILLGFEPKVNMSDVFAGRAKLADIIVNHSSGLDIIPASSGVVEITHLSQSEQLSLVSAVDDLASDYDYMIVDTAAGIGDNVVYFNVAAEEVIVVIDPQPTSLTDAYAVIKVLSSKCGIKKFSVITNRVPVGNDGKGTFGQLALPVSKFLNATLKFLGSIQEDSSVTEAILKQRAYVELYPSCRASLDIGKIAKRLIDDPAERTARGGLQFFFRQLVEHAS